MVETGERICEVQCNAPTFTVSWHPQKPLLAFACDDKVQCYPVINQFSRNQLEFVDLWSLDSNCFLSTIIIQLLFEQIHVRNKFL